MSHILYVGSAERIRVTNTKEALKVATEMMPDKNLGDHINIYRSPDPLAQVYGRVKVCYDHGLQRNVYVYYCTESKYGYTILCDYAKDPMAKWENIDRRSWGASARWCPPRPRRYSSTPTDGVRCKRSRAT